MLANLAVVEPKSYMTIATQTGMLTRTEFPVPRTEQGLAQTSSMALLIRGNQYSAHLRQAKRRHMRRHVVIVVPISIGNATFGGAAAQKPFNEST